MAQRITDVIEQNGVRELRKQQAHPSHVDMVGGRRQDERMNAATWRKRFFLAALGGALAFGGWALAQTGVQSANTPGYYVIPEERPGAPSAGVGRLLDTVETKLNRIIQQQGGRYIFLVSKEGDLWRLDTFTGKVAILNLVSGAEWDTLDVPEKTLGPGNAFYEQFVQKLDRIDFNTN